MVSIQRIKIQHFSALRFSSIYQIFKQNVQKYVIVGKILVNNESKIKILFSHKIFSGISVGTIWSVNQNSTISIISYSAFADEEGPINRLIDCRFDNDNAAIFEEEED